MKPALFRAVKSVLGHGKRRSQPFWEKMYTFSVHGMNFAMAQCATSGEQHAMRYVRDRLAARRQAGTKILFDVGANVGEYASCLADCFRGDDVIIHAFEPSAATFKTLTANLRDRENVRCHPLGLGDAEATLDLFYDQPGSSVASVYQQRADHGEPLDHRETIHITTLDRFCAEHALDRIDFLKIDIEGHEFKALQGASGLLRAPSAITFIQWEFGPRHVDARTFFRDFFYLLKDEYHIYRIVQDGLFPIPRYTEYHELFGGPINYLAERKAP